MMPRLMKRRGLTWAQVQMSILAVIAVVLTVVSFTYILVVRPPYLRATRYGVPFYSSQVINPVTQQPVALNTLAYHYTTGKIHGRVAGKKVERTAKKARDVRGNLTLSTLVQIGMFFVAFYIMYLAFIGDPFGK